MVRWIFRCDWHSSNLTVCDGKLTIYSWFAHKSMRIFHSKLSLYQRLQEQARMVSFSSRGQSQQLIPPSEALTVRKKTQRLLVVNGS